MGAFQSAVNSAIGSVSQIAGINKLIKKRAGTPMAPQGPTAPTAPAQNNIQAESVQSQAKKIATKSSGDAVAGKKAQKTAYATKLSATAKSTDTTSRPKSTPTKSGISDADLTRMVKELLGNGRK